MPSRRRVRLSADAEDDIRDILQYSLTNWGTEQHVIFYSVEEAAISVARVLHAKMNPTGRFAEWSGLTFGLDHDDTTG